MDYDFSGLCVDQIEKLEKRLQSFKKACIKEYEIILHAINHPIANEHIGSIKTEVDDLFNDCTNKASIFFTECMNKSQRVLKKHLT